MYIMRSLGTLVAMALSYVAWYIVDGHTAGVIVFFFIFCHGYIWLMIKYPSMLIVSQIGQITMVNRITHSISRASLILILRRSLF